MLRLASRLAKKAVIYLFFPSPISRAEPDFFLVPASVLTWVRWWHWTHSKLELAPAVLLVTEWWSPSDWKSVASMSSSSTSSCPPLSSSLLVPQLQLSLSLSRIAALSFWLLYTFNCNAETLCEISQLWQTHFAGTSGQFLITYTIPTLWYQYDLKFVRCRTKYLDPAGLLL